MEEHVDQAKGKVKQAVGDLADDDNMRRDGKMDELGGKIKEALGKVKDKLDDTIDDVKNLKKTD